jgi:hypothetical protein
MNGVKYPSDVETIRTRIQKMTDEQLLRYGVVARYMSSPEANPGKPPREDFVIQLDEARAEWRRRNPKPSVIADSF